jgi:hypothetical protein
MSKAVWKYPLFLGKNELELPRGSRILYVGDDNGIPTLWALVATAPEYPREIRNLVVRGTGHPVDPLVEEYIGTWQAPPYVWHLFELPRSEG